MNVLGTYKSGANTSLILFEVPDAIAQDVTQAITSMISRYVYGNDTKMANTSARPAMPARPATSGPRYPADGADRLADVQAMRQMARTGSPMHSSQRNRVEELLGVDKANAIFGQHGSYEAYRLFQALDPKRVQRNPETSAWEVVDNELWDQSLYDYVMKMDVSEWLDEFRQEQEANAAYEGQTFDITPEAWIQQIQGQSYSGTPLSPGQIKFLNGKWKNIVRYCFPGGKRGDGNAAVDTLIKYASERIRTAQGEWQDNVNYDPAFEAHLKKVISGGK